MINIPESARSKVLAALVTCVALAAAFLTLPISANAEDSASNGADSDIITITNGSVTWGMRESWRNYIGDGAILYDGVTLNDKGEYVWPIKSGTYNTSTKALHLTLGGYIHNLAYCVPADSDNCSLDVIFRDLEVDITPDVQQVTGIYEGNSRDNMADIEVKDRASWAVFDVPPESFKHEDGTTTFSELTGFISDLELYPKGSVADPLTIEYEGPGGVPDFGRKLGKPGSLRLVIEDEGTVVPGYPHEGLDRYYTAPVYPIPDTNKVLLVKYTYLPADPDYSSELEFKAIDTVSRVVEQEFSYRYRRKFAPMHWPLDLVFDGGNSFYFFEQSDYVPPTGFDPNKGSPHRLTLSRVSYDGTSFNLDKELWKVDPVGKNTSAGWDPVRGKLIYATRPAGGLQDSGGLLYLVDVTAGNPGQNDAPAEKSSIALPTDNLENYPGASFQESADFPISSVQPAVLLDGSYIFPSGAPSWRNKGVNYRGNDDQDHLFPPVWINPDDPLGKEYGVFAGRFLADANPIAGRRGSDGLNGWRKILPVSEDKFFGVGAGLEQLFNLYQLVPEEVGGGMMTLKNASPVWHSQAEELSEAAGPTAAYNSNAGYGVYYGNVVQELILFDTEGVQEEYFSAHLRRLDGEANEVAIRDNGEVIFGGLNEDKDLTIYTGFAYRYGKFATQPQAQTADLGDELSVPVTFSATVTDDTEDPEYQWQVKLANQDRFTDVSGATEPTYTFDAKPEDHGSVYRLLVKTKAGWTASEEAPLTVTWNPYADFPVSSVTVKPGEDAKFSATFNMPEGSTLGWNRYDKASGLWQPIESDGSVFIVESEGNTTTLTIKNANKDMTGMQVQAFARTPGGVVVTSDGKLTVGKEDSKKPIDDPDKNKPKRDGDDSSSVTSSSQGDKNNDGNTVQTRLLSATNVFGAIMAMLTAFQTWLILASMPGGVPAQLAKVFPPTMLQLPGR